MKVYLIRGRSNVNAIGEYNPSTNELIVLAGSTLSSNIARSAKFRGTKSIEKWRTGVVDQNILQKDIAFKSPSTAGNFVTGKSTNGLTAWKDETGRTIKEIQAEAK